MRIIDARNINDAWDRAKIILNDDHVVRPSRVGEVWECTEPVTTRYTNPCERVLFDSRRNANCFFHFFESLHMLAGRDDVAWLEQFNSKIRDFVGKDDHQHGAYGYRWRYFFDMDGGAEDGYADQLFKIIKMLRANPNERRAVLTMWSPLADLDRPDVADLPCNTQVYFKIREGRLCQIVTCRSNDIQLGCYGANAVHFSFLLEYMAAMIGVPVGTYWQVSDSWHAYTSRWEKAGGLDMRASLDYYSIGTGLPVFPLVSQPDTFDDELKLWMDRDADAFECGFENMFFPLVAEPLWLAWQKYKEGDLEAAQTFASRCAAPDWKIAACDWLFRIKQNREKKGA